MSHKNIKPVLKVKELSVSFQQYTKGLRQRQLKVITSLNVSINAREIVAVVGSSGSGKSLLAHAVLGILPKNACVEGEIYFEGEELDSKLQDKLRGKEITMVPQSVNFLDPLMRVGNQVRTAVRNGESTKVQREVFARYNLAPRVESLYPFQVSGGMARRVLVAAAMVSGAKLVIADEPTPGLDSEVINETLQHFRQMADEGCGVMLITHDMEAALKVADHIAVFYAGTTVEVAPVEDFKGRGEKLRHPYSKALIRALPGNDFVPVPGAQPLPNALPPGCLFEPRCPIARKDCALALPQARELRDGIVRCLYAT